MFSSIDSIVQAVTNQNDTTAPQYRIHIQGKRFKSDILGVAVYEEVRAPSMFTLQLSTWDDEQQEWAGAEKFELGDEVEISLGYGNNTKKLMVGEITGLEPEFAYEDIPVLTVRGYDYGHRLLRGCKTQTFTNKKDSNIAGKIALKYGLMYEGKDTKVSLDYVLQHNQTDWEFLQQRAQRIGYEVVVREKTLYFQPPQHQSQPRLTLSPRGDMLMFSARLTALTQVGQVEVRGWNQKEKKPFVERAKTSDRHMGPKAADQAFGYQTTGRLVRPVFNKAQAKQVAQGQFDDMALSYIIGEGLCTGDPELRAGSCIKIKGVGQQYNGDYYVTEATHTYSSKRGYRTAFVIHRNKTS